MRLIKLLAMGVLVCASSLGQTAQKNRGLAPTDAPAEPKPAGPYYALVIGNNDYQHVDKLETPVNDAREVSQILHDRFGFQTQVIYNATRAQILEAIDSYRALPLDSNLLLYYAGHGHRDKDANEAYWLPVDADRVQRPNWINSSDITDGVHAIKSRHILIISDSCFSGDLAMRNAKATIASGGHNAIVAKALSLNSRHIMSSGGDEPVADSGTGGHSVFAAALLQSLNDMEYDVFRANDLFDRVQHRVEMRSQASQTPRYDILRDSSADFGDFVFFRSAKEPSGRASEAGVAQKPTKNVEAMLIEAKANYQSKHYERALPLLRSAAEAGNAEAAFYLGLMYEGGQGGLTKDDAQAVTWYRKAAGGGNTSAMLNLGFMCEKGRGGLATDDVQAVAWYRKAADSGDAHGMANLGTMYENGRGGLATDDAQAVTWYRKAADGGYAPAMATLGIMYENGRGGLAKDDAQAVIWFSKAAEAGNSKGMGFLGTMYLQGRGGLPQDDQQALSWFRKAADLEGARGMAGLGYMYETGRGGLAKDDAQAAAWYRKAADGGYAPAMATLGFMYENGRGGLAKDESQAVSWYRKAAALGDEKAKKALTRFAVKK